MLSPSSECQDNDDFKYDSGLGCEFVQRISLQSCSLLREAGVKSMHAFEINCPKSCGLCNLMFEESKQDLETPSEHPSHMPSSALDSSITLAHECRDQKNYFFVSDLGCEFIQVLNLQSCSHLSEVGVSPKDIVNINRYCPKTCGVCDTRGRKIKKYNRTP
mmetsp:Transcript_6759/g.14551  ORF Transcript_6759/g.14551 Transcript_6759/m.14551 type:complete len:161 (-) Transcript_6759:742-1224(-)